MDRPPPPPLPPRVAAEVDRILARAARRLLEERLKREAEEKDSGQK